LNREGDNGMSTDVDRIKKLISNDLLVAAVELPSNHRSKSIVVDDIEDVLAQFEEDADYAHFVIRVKRSSQPLPKPSADPQPPQLSIDSMVNETLEMSERMAESRALSGFTMETDQTKSPEQAEYSADFLLENANLLEENGDYDLARNIYQSLIRKGQAIPQALAGVARSHEKKGENQKAIRCYQEAIAYSSELTFFQSLAAVYIRIGEDEDAAKTILHALGIAVLTEEQRFELHKSLGNCYTRIADYSKAEHHYRKAYELNANSDVLQVNVGSLALQMNDFESAQKHFQKALELNAKNDKAISGLGMIHLEKNNLAKAHDCFAASLKLNLNNLGAIYNMVKCAYELKRFDEASALLKKYITSNPVNTNILYSYAGILYHQGEYSLAVTEVKRILEANPGHAGARELGELIAQKLT